MWTTPCTLDLQLAKLFNLILNWEILNMSRLEPVLKNFIYEHYIYMHKNLQFFESIAT